MNIGKTIKFLREHKGLTQQCFSSLLEISTPFLSQIEKETRRPTLDLLEKIAHTLEISLGTLILISSEKNEIPELPSNISEKLITIVSTLTNENKQIKPYYTKKPISNIHSLALLLETNEKALLKLQKECNLLYRLSQKPLKKNRVTFAAQDFLKEIQTKIKEKIFYNVFYPHYLTGGVKGSNNLKNADVHKNANFLVKIDIANFFPSVKKKYVYNMWKFLFNFSDNVAICLTDLTTKDEFLVQGACTSSYIANLLFYNYEPDIYEELLDNHFKYTRFIDDISVSSHLYVTNDKKTEITRKIIKMLYKHELKPNRKKLQMASIRNRLSVTGPTIAKGRLYPKKTHLNDIKSAIHKNHFSRATGILNYAKNTHKFSSAEPIPKKLLGLEEKVNTLKIKEKT